MEWELKPMHSLRFRAAEFTWKHSQVDILASSSSFEKRRYSILWIILRISQGVSPPIALTASPRVYLRLRKWILTTHPIYPCCIWLKRKKAHLRKCTVTADNFAGIRKDLKIFFVSFAWDRRWPAALNWPNIRLGQFTEIYIPEISCFMRWREKSLISIESAFYL